MHAESIYIDDGMKEEEEEEEVKGGIMRVWEGVAVVKLKGRIKNESLSWWHWNIGAYIYKVGRPTTPHDLSHSIFSPRWGHLLHPYVFTFFGLPYLVREGRTIKVVWVRYGYLFAFMNGNFVFQHIHNCSGLPLCSSKLLPTHTTHVLHYYKQQNHFLPPHNFLDTSHE